MNTYISILRGINVGGHRKIIMAELKKMYHKVGFKEVKTYIQSGNVVFQSESPLAIHELEALLEDRIHKTFGHEVPVLIRTHEEWTKAIEENPFLADPEIDIAQLSMTLFNAEPDSNLIDSLNTSGFLPDKIMFNGKHAYILCPGGKFHLSPITHSLLEKKLKVKASTRNWKTVMKLKSLSE